ncbi:MAG: TonB-dependent receptor [Bacteroidota bacterium]
MNFTLKSILIYSFLSIVSLSVFAQQKSVLSGYIRDNKTGEELIGVSVLIKENGKGAITNEYGFFSLTLPPATYTVSVKYLGYTTVTQTIDLSTSQKLNLELAPQNKELKTVNITSEKKDENLKTTEMSTNKLDMKTISKIPALLGEVDLVRSIQLLPGVSTVGEGASGFNVRGGSIDQNLILLDEAPVYNSSHLFGFFSVFNPDAVKDVKLFKGGINAKYGGRLSSILDVRLKEGNKKHFAAQGGIGLIFSRLTLEGPIKKGKGSYIIAGRRSYGDVLATPFLAGNADFKGFQLYFYDLTVKGNYSLSEKDKVYLSGYMGRDVFGVASFGFNWGNQTLTARWNHIFSDKLFSNTTAFYSNYDYGIGTDNIGAREAFKWTSRIINYSLKQDFTWYLNSKNTINFGGQSIFYQFQPANASFVSGGIRQDINLPYKYALENALYASNDQVINSRISLSYGLRFSTFHYLGKGVRQNYGEGFTSFGREYISSQSFNDFESIQNYFNLEPRAAVKYELNATSSLKASYMRTTQYVHLISNTAASIPLDVWTPSTNNIKPQLSDQVAIGYFKNFGSTKNDYETSVEAYYKTMQNQIDYVDGADLLLNPYLEGQILSGKGRAYGLEFFVKKNTGRLTGFISYTLARTERQVDRINNNDWYPTRFDKLHNLNLVVSYDLTKRWTINTNLVYGSGTPVNLPTNAFVFEGYQVPHNPAAPRNNIRIPDFFRIDLTATVKSKDRKQPDIMPTNFFKRMKYTYEWEIVFGVYNLLGKRNAFAVYPRINDKSPAITELVQFSLFAVPIPAFTYNFKF